MLSLNNYLANGCIHESSYAVISVHRTIEGTNDAMEKDRKKAKEEYDALYAYSEAPIEFGAFECWRVVEVNVVD